MAESNTLNYISPRFVSKNIQREPKTGLPIRNELSIQQSQYYIIPQGTLNSTNVHRLPITTKETVMQQYGYPCLEYFIIEKHVKGGNIKDKRSCKGINKKNMWLPQQPLVAPQLFFFMSIDWCIDSSLWKKLLLSVIIALISRENLSLKMIFSRLAHTFKGQCMSRLTLHQAYSIMHFFVLFSFLKFKVIIMYMKVPVEAPF